MRGLNMRRIGRSAAVVLSAALTLSACSGEPASRSGSVQPQTSSSVWSSAAEPLLGSSGNSSAADEPPTRVLVARVDGYPVAGPNIPRLSLDGSVIGSRVNCRSGDRLPRIILGHAGWPSPAAAGRGLLERPGGDRAVVVLVAPGAAVVVVSRGDGSVRARVVLDRLHGRWYPQTMRLCVEGRAENMTRTGPVNSTEAVRCVDQYSPRALRDRAFAFDGVVVDIGGAGSNRPGKGYLELAAVTFTVEEWFYGGAGTEVIIDMAPPADPTVPSGESVPSYGIGFRLLVSGEPRWGGSALEDAIAWGCGFTRYYDSATAATWRETFEMEGQLR